MNEPRITTGRERFLRRAEARTKVRPVGRCVLCGRLVWPREGVIRTEEGLEHDPPCRWRGGGYRPPND